MRITLLIFSFFLTACAGSTGRSPASDDPKEFHSFAADGEFSARVRFTPVPETKREALQGILKFEPAPAAAACKKIAWVQVARVSKENSENYDWAGSEAPRNELRSDSGFFVDHLAKSCGKGKPCSPYFADHWPNAGGSSFGSVAGEGSARTETPASLEDYPFAGAEFRRIELEACAVCVGSGEIYGCVRWGGGWAASGERSVSKIRSRAEPSESFRRAREIFKAYYGN